MPTDSIGFRTVIIDEGQGIQALVGQAHFHALTVHALFQAVAVGAPQSDFGIAFCEASGDSLIRTAGNSPTLASAASRYALRIAAGHVFVILLKGAFPIQVLNAVKNVPSVATVFGATGNALCVIIADCEGSSGIVGVADGNRPTRVETEGEGRERRLLLGKLGYVEPY